MSYSLSAPPRRRFGLSRRKAQEWDGRSSDQITLATNLSPFEGRKEGNWEKRMKERSYAKALLHGSEGWSSHMIASRLLSETIRI